MWLSANYTVHWESSTQLLTDHQEDQVFTSPNAREWPLQFTKTITSIALLVPFVPQRSVEAGAGEKPPSASERERERERRDSVAMVCNCFFINVSVRSCPAWLIPRVHIHLLPHRQLTADVHWSYFMLTYNPSLFSVPNISDGCILDTKVGGITTVKQPLLCPQLSLHPSCLSWQLKSSKFCAPWITTDSPWCKRNRVCGPTTFFLCNFIWLKTVCRQAQEWHSFWRGLYRQSKDRAMDNRNYFTSYALLTFPSLTQASGCQ